MRNNDPLFFPEESFSNSIRQSMERNYSDCINILQTQWYQADLDQRFSMGDQDIWGLIFPGVATYRRKIFNFNLINRAVQMVSGYQRRNRKSTICTPTLPHMQKTADQLTKCLYHVHKNGTYEIYSDAFEMGALTKGIGLVSIFKDTTNDPVSGDIRMRYVDFNSVLIDPYFRQNDLSDCRFIWTRQFFDRNEAAVLYPQFADQILSLASGSYRDDKFYYMPEVYQIQFPNLVAFDEYWYLSSRECTYLVDTETQETKEAPFDEEDLRVIMREFKGRLKVVKHSKPTVRRTIILNDRVLVDEPNPYGLDRYPYVAWLGYMNANSPYYAYKFRGIVRDMRDAQYLFNRRKVTDLDILEAQQQGLKVRQGALVTPDDSLNQGNGRVLTIKDDPRYSMQDVEPMPIIPPAPGMLQMEDMLKQTLIEISGVNEELLGSASDDKAGILSMLRQGAGLTTLQKLFDQADASQRQCGEIIIEMIQKNWTYGKVKQIIGEEPTAEFDNKAFFQYGCKVVAGVLTESQQQLELQQKIYLKEAGLVNFTQREILESVTMQNKDKVMERLDKEEAAQAEAAKKMEELQMQQMQVDNATKIAYAHSQEGLAAERTAKIQLDKALNFERIQRAKEDKSSTILNLVKAIKELKSMDLEHIERQMAILGEIQDRTITQENSTQENEKQLTSPKDGG